MNHFSAIMTGIACFSITLAAHAVTTTNLPTSVSGGTGTAADIQANDGSFYTAAKGNTISVGGYSSIGGAISSVVLHVEFTVDAGYDGTSAILVNGVNTAIVPVDGDTDRAASIDITAGSFGIDTWPEVVALAVTFLNGDNGGPDSVAFDFAYLVITHEAPLFPPEVDSETPTNALPVSGGTSWGLVFSDEFNGASLDTSKWGIDVSASSRNPRASRGIDDWWWVAENVSLDGSNLVLAVVKRDANTMDCGSVSSDGLYEPKYGYLEARVEIADTTKDTHTAFWLQGPNMNNADPADNTAHDGAEVDIFESAWFGNYTKSVVHIDGYDADHMASTKQYNTAGLHSGYHVFGLEWTADYMNIYYDGALKVTYTGTWVPRTNEWIWLSDGASFGDIGTFSSEPVGWLTAAKFDYVRVWESVPNATPAFTNDPIVRSAATADVVYSNSLSGAATDDDGDPIIYSKDAGPSWLNVASDGTLSGTPGSDDVGTNSWTVRATDPNDAYDTATLNMEVLPTGLASPENLTATSISTNQVGLGWGDASTNETGFSVERSLTSSTGFAAVGSAAMNATNYTDNTVSPGYTYYYRVSATNAAESGNPSAEAWATVPKMPATVTLGDLTQTYDGNACTATVSTVPEGLACDITYDGGATLPTNVGSYAVVATINEVSYQGTTNGTLVVSKGTPIVSVWPTATSIETGQAVSNSVLSGGTATASGVFVFENPSQTPAIGTNAVSVIFTSTDSINYNNVTGTVDVVVTATLIPATVNLDDLAQTYDGNAVTATVWTVPADLAVSMTYDGTSVLPTNAGSYAVVGNVVEAGYKGSTNGTLVVSKATPVVSPWPTASTIVVGQTVSNATLSGGSPSVSGSFSYNTPAATPAVGTNTMNVTFTPTDTDNYNTVAGTVDVTVLPLPPSAPTGLNAVGSFGQVDLAWEASAGATSYNVKRSPTQGGGYVTVGTPTATNYNDSVANGQTYYYVVSAENAGGEGPNSVEVSATLLHALPFCEDFEGLSVSDWDGQNLWAASNATVQSSLKLDTQAGSITSEVGFASQSFVGTESNVWTDMEIQPVFCPADMTPSFADATASVYFNTNGNPVAFDGTNRIIYAGKVVTTGNWVRVTIHSDYSAKTWDLYVDSEQIGTNLGFYSESATKLEKLDVRGGAPDVMAVDNITLSSFSPFGEIFWLTVNSLYGTPSPSGSTSYISNTLVNAYAPSSPVANGATQYVAAGWAGTGSATNGSGTNTSFIITNDTTITWQWQTNYWINLQTDGE